MEKIQLPDFGDVYLGSEDAYFFLESSMQSGHTQLVIVHMAVDGDGKGVLFDDIVTPEELHEKKEEALSGIMLRRAIKEKQRLYEETCLKQGKIIISK